MVFIYQVILGRNYALEENNERLFDNFASLLKNNNFENIKKINCRFNSGNLKDFIDDYNDRAIYDEKRKYFERILETLKSQTVFELKLTIGCPIIIYY